MDNAIYRRDETKTVTDYFAHGEDEETLKIYETDTVQEMLDIRFDGSKDHIAIVAKENILGSPYKGIPHPDYPSQWLTVTFGEFGSLVRATAYVLKKKFDLAPYSRVGIVGNALPHYQLICYALWYMRCTVIGIPPKLGNDVKQFWVRMLDIKMLFYDKNLIIYDEEKQQPLDEGGEWIWPWEYPLTDEEYNLSAGYKGIPMFSLYQKEFCEEIYQAKLEGKCFKRKGDKDDIVTIVGTSSSSQAIIKNGQCSKMKFVPLTAHTNFTPYQNYMNNTYDQYISAYVNVPFYHGMGNSWVLNYGLTYGGAIIYHTQQLCDIGFIPEILLDDIMETNVQRILLFPFHFTEIKKIFESNHPRCPEWKKCIMSKPTYAFRTAGAPLSQEVQEWFQKEFDHKVFSEYGASEANMMMFTDVSSEILPGEEGYYTKCPWFDFYLKPLDEKDPNIGELYAYSTFLTTGYARRAEKGQFYESPLPGLRVDIEAENLFMNINGLNFYKTNDIWIRSPKSGKYKYISRVDDVITFATGLKMNPLPFEETITYDCKNIRRCCLLLDDTQYEVVCFIEPEWSEIIMEDGKTFDINNNSEDMSKEEIVHLRKVAQKQVWDSIYSILMDSSKSLSNWAKQLTINNVVIIDYGKKFPVTAKGSLARRVARLEYSYVLKKISKLISGEITEIEEIKEEEKEEEKEEKEVEINNEKSSDKENEQNEQKEEIENNKEENTKSEIKETVTNSKTQEEIDEEIQNAVMIVYESIKEIIPSTPDFEEFNIHAPFTMYSIDSLATRKLTNVLARRTKKEFSASTLFNYGTPYDLAKYITGNDDKIENQCIPKTIKEKKIGGKVAVIGMALRLPGAINNAKSFWMALAKGRDCVVPPVKDRKLHTGYVNKPANLLGENEHNIPRCGCYDSRPNVAKPSEFDAEFFNCLPEEVASMDPRQRWVLETSWEALENSGIAPNSLENTTTGVFVGVNDDHDYQDLMKENGVVPAISAHSSPSGITGRLSYFYKLFGPSFTIDTACSTGASALHAACRSLQFGDCDLSIVSGVKYMFSSDNFHKTSIARMTSPSGRCATFDKDADGFAPGEGCVTFILKRYEDAVRDKDNIHSVVLGTSSGQSGLRQSISAPSSEGQALNMKKVFEFAGIKPSDVSFVEAHGTGTPLGDALEINGLNQIYAGSHTKENPLIVGSVKTNIGHTCEAAGLAGMAKVILAMQHKYIPKNLHFNTLNPEIDVESIPIQIPTKIIPWQTPDNKPRIAQVSSYGLQGSIVHIILQEYVPEKEEEEKNKDSKEDRILTISAKTPAALLELCNSYLSVLEGMEDNEENIENLCYTSNVGRQHFDYRISASGKNAIELYDDLEKQVEILENDQSLIEKKIANSGRGITQNIEVYAENAENISIPSKALDSMKELLSIENVFKSSFEICESEVQKIFEGVSLEKMIEEEKNGSLLDNSKKQALLISFYYSLNQFIESVLVKDNSSKKIYGGFGFGELISLVVCGGLDISSALSLIKNGSEDISSWYEKQELPKLKKTVFIPSLEKEFKNGDTLSQDDISTIMKNIKEMKNYESLINKYVNKSKNMILFSMNDSQEIISRCPNVQVIKFFEKTEKELLDQFIMNQYNNGQNINWEVFNSRIEADTQKPCAVHKIEIPTYPFQRSTYWPIPLNH